MSEVIDLDSPHAARAAVGAPPRSADWGGAVAAGDEAVEVAVSVVIPAKNEAGGLQRLLPELCAGHPDWEIIVVDDGSTDGTGDLCALHGVRVVRHAYSIGNGAAVKSGARAASGKILVFMDADGQHKASDVDRLVAKLHEGYDMVVGARSSTGDQAGLHRAAANGLYNQLASWMVGQRVADLTSGFRAVRADRFRQFLYLLPNGFSYPTTITMSFFRAGYQIFYLPIQAPRRIGRSHVKITRDGVRFLLIIFKIGTLYSPLKIFLPISASFFFTALCYYAYTFLSFHRFTNMSALLFINAVLVFLIGLVSEQITALNYKDSNHS